MFLVDNRPRTLKVHMVVRFKSSDRLAQGDLVDPRIPLVDLPSPWHFLPASSILHRHQRCRTNAHPWKCDRTLMTYAGRGPAVLSRRPSE